MTYIALAQFDIVKYIVLYSVLADLDKLYTLSHKLYFSKWYFSLSQGWYYEGYMLLTLPLMYL